MKKKIPLDHLRPGMYLIGMDQSWWNTPFLLHHRYIKNEEEIEQLRKSNVRFVVIDTSKGPSDESPDSDESNSSTSSTVTPIENDRAMDHSGGHGEPGMPCTKDVQNACADSPISQIWDVQEKSPLKSEVQKMSSDVAARQVRDAAVRAVEQVFEGVLSGEPLDNPLLEQTTHDIVQSVVDDPQALSQLVLIQNLSTVDKYLYHHVVDVCALSVLLGIELGWEHQTLQTLAMGALLHDIGYVRLPNNLVRNRKNAGEADRRLLVKHSEVGQGIVKTSLNLSPEIHQIVLEHHERLDGSGEPYGLQGEKLSSMGQVVGLVDQFDKLTSNWGMGPSRSAALVLRELYQEAKSGRFSVRPIERLIQCLGVYPLGSLVELATGERGVVVETDPSNLLKPKIKVVARPDNLPYPVPFIIDLTSPAYGDPDRSIRVLLDARQEHIHVEKYFSQGRVSLGAEGHE